MADQDKSPFDEVHEVLSAFSVAQSKRRWIAVLSVAAPVVLFGAAFIAFAYSIGGKRAELEGVRSELAAVHAQVAEKSAEVRRLEARKIELDNEIRVREADKAILLQKVIGNKPALLDLPRASYRKVPGKATFEVQLWLDESLARQEGVTKVRYELDPVYYPRIRTLEPRSATDRAAMTAMGPCRSRVTVFMTVPAAGGDGDATEQVSVNFDWCKAASSD